MREYGSKWKRDINIENEIKKFMDENFYKSETKNFRRKEDNLSQKLGIDIIFDWEDGTNLLVDEKAQTHYINKNLPTFAFEISYIMNGEKKEGWLIDENKCTEYYMLEWIFADEDENITKEDITSIECLMISRDKVLEYLRDNGFDRSLLRLKDKISRTKNIYGHSIEKTNSSNFYFYLTNTLAERPFNVIIRKNKLESLGEIKFTVKENKIYYG